MFIMMLDHKVESHDGGGGRLRGGVGGVATYHMPWSDVLWDEVLIRPLGGGGGVRGTRAGLTGLLRDKYCGGSVGSGRCSVKYHRWCWW